MLSEQLGSQTDEPQNLEINFPNAVSRNLLSSNYQFITLIEKTTPFTVEIIPRSSIDPETEEYISQRPKSSLLVKTANSTGSRVLMISIAIIAVIGSVGGGCSLGFLNIGGAMMKLFMIIEVIGKFLYLPIWYKGLLLETLYSISILGDLVELNPDTFVSTSEDSTG